MDWLNMVANFGGKYADYDIAKRTLKAQTEAHEAAFERQNAVVAATAAGSFQHNAMTLQSLMPVLIICVVGFVALRA